MLVTGFLSLPASSQFVGNKLNFYAAFESDIMHGKHILEEDGFAFPSLFANERNVHGFSVKALIHHAPHYSVGAKLNVRYASGWQFQNISNFSGSRYIQCSFAPVFQVHTLFRFSGIGNCLKPFAELSPVLGLTKLKIVNPLFEIHAENGEVFSPTTDQNMFYGFVIGTGIEATIHHSFGLFVSYSFQNDWTSPDLYFDSHFMFSQIDFGFLFRLKKNKVLYE